MRPARVMTSRCHVDTHKAAVEDVKQFLWQAFYKRFRLLPDPDFVETSPGAGAIGVTIAPFDFVAETREGTTSGKGPRTKT